MTLPRAYFLTWTTYGTWLHGDARGSVDDAHNTYGTSVVAPDEHRRRGERSTMIAEAVVLDDPSRRDVRDAILERARFVAARVLALSVRTNHVHLIVAATTPDPARLAGGFKSWGTRRLRESGRFARDAKIWTNQASTKYLWDDASVAGAVEYVLVHQGPPDEFTVRGA